MLPLNNNKSLPVTCNSVEGNILVSIILINNNNIKNLIHSIVKHSEGIRYELIIVTNQSKSNISHYLEHYSGCFTFKIIKNKPFVSYAHANNMAVQASTGKYIVLYDSNVTPLKNWLNHLLSSAESIENIGMVGARLVHDCSTNIIKKQLFKATNCTTYHAGIAYQDETNLFTPFNIGEGKTLDDKTVLTSKKRSSSTPSCLLLAKSLYLKAGGMDESFFLSNASIDLGLRLSALGYTNYYNADSVLTYHKKIFRLKANTKIQADFSLLQKKWFHALKNSYWSEKIYNQSPLISETPLTIAFAVTDHGDSVTAGDYFTAQELAIVLESYGWKINYLSRKKGEWYKISNDTDIILSFLDSYDLHKIPKEKKDS